MLVVDLICRSGLQGAGYNLWGCFVAGLGFCVHSKQRRTIGAIATQSQENVIFSNGKWDYFKVFEND